MCYVTVTSMTSVERPSNRSRILIVTAAYTVHSNSFPFMFDIPSYIFYYTTLLSAFFNLPISSDGDQIRLGRVP